MQPLLLRATELVYAKSGARQTHALQVMPVLLSAVKTSDDPLRLYLLRSLTELVSVLRQHVRKYLADLLSLVHYYWPTEKLLPVLLLLVSEIAGTRERIAPHFIHPRCTFRAGKGRRGIPLGRVTVA